MTPGVIEGATEGMKLTHEWLVILVVLAVIVNKLVGIVEYLVKKWMYGGDTRNRRAEPQYLEKDDFYEIMVDYAKASDVLEIKSRLIDIVTESQCKKCNLEVNRRLDEIHAGQSAQLSTLQTVASKVAYIAGRYDMATKKELK